MSLQNLRNIAIVAHVDHGKTTLIDAMLKQSGTFRDNERVIERVMDSNDLERERGITILAKNTSVKWRGTKVNIVDTPGHADFGGEVERALMMADGALLLVDAAEGPLPQTRFVLRKCLEKGFPIIVVINKIDRSDARPLEALSETFDLFCDLEASDAQADFPTLYAVGRMGIAKYELKDADVDLAPLFETIIRRIPAPFGDPSAPLQVIVCNINHDDYVGRIGIGRIVNGSIRKGETVTVISGNQTRTATVKVLYTFEGLRREERESASAGENIAVAGIDEIDIGDTVASHERPRALPRIRVDAPTIKLRIGVNTSPFSGRSPTSKFLTSRQLRERLEAETRRNLAVRMKPTENPDTFELHGRGELQLAILFETMRREGYEMVIGNPEVITREVNGTLMEPVELVIVDIPETCMGPIADRLGRRGGRITKIGSPGSGRTRLEFRAPSRTLIGFRGEFLTITRGTGLLNTMLDGWEPWKPSVRRLNGAIVADRPGVATPYALFHLQPRGIFFIVPGVSVYEGMIVGEHNRPNDTDVNIIKEKKLSNVRSKLKDDNVMLDAPRTLTIESALEWIDADELVEVTPDVIRVRKQILSCSARPRRRRDAIVDAQTSS
ncbi:MAG: translational GTPase TypA [Deltaproteobacteria bacterium]|nr:translational GTPase TypA [Deltaproteobacteria bacterium]